MMNTMVVRKLLDGFKHMTYTIAQQTESMSTFRNLVWHEFEIITRITVVLAPPPCTNPTHFLYRSIFLS